MHSRPVPDGFFDSSGRVGPRARALEVRRVSIDGQEYPALLKEIPDPPHTLWVAGCDLRDVGPCIAVIGARQATQYGIDVAHKIAGDLVLSGICVVSGMARGADAAAHAGALDAGGRTVAVLGCGPDVCYPSGSKGLYVQIAGTGAIVAEAPPGTSVGRHLLRRRNQILIGMSHAVVVVQGDTQSAAVGTGFLAADFNRDVFAVPGPIDWPMSKGVNLLLKKGAAVCTGAGDVIERVFADLAAKQGSTDFASPVLVDALPADQQTVIAALQDAPLEPEALLERTGLTPTLLYRAVSSLETLGVLQSLGPLLAIVKSSPGRDSPPVRRNPSQT